MEDNGTEVGEQLRNFFERFRDEGYAPAMAAWIDELQTSGELGEEAAAALRSGERAPIEEYMAAPEGVNPPIFVFWPPGGM